MYIHLFIDEDVLRRYYAVAAILKAPVEGHPKAWLRQDIEQLIVRETAALRDELDEQLGNIKEQANER
jgi:hypothetical protein